MAKRKTKKARTNVLLSLIAMVASALTSLALFTNVWNWQVIQKNSTDTTKVGGYFEDMEAFAAFFAGDTKLPTWASTLAGIAVIVSLVFAVIFIFSTTLKIMGKSNKTIDSISKLSCYMMLIAGITALVGSLIFVLAKYEGIVLKLTYTMSMSIGAIAGFVFPTLGGILGLVANKK